MNGVCYDREPFSLTEFGETSVYTHTCTEHLVGRYPAWNTYVIETTLYTACRVTNEYFLPTLSIDMSASAVVAFLDAVILYSVEAHLILNWKHKTGYSDHQTMNML